MAKEEKGKKEIEHYGKKRQTNLKKNNIEIFKCKQYWIFELKKKFNRCLKEK